MEWSGTEARQCLELLSWKLDVEWCGFLISEQSQSPLCDGQANISWETLAETLGLGEKLPSTSPQLYSSYSPVKVTGVVLLLGLGSYLCYKLYKVWLYQRFQSAGGSGGNDDPRPPPASFSDGTPAFSYHHLSDSSSKINDLLNVKTRYFGPLNLNSDNFSESEVTQDHVFTSAVDQAVEERCKPSREKHKRYKLTSPPSANSSGSRRGWLLHKLQSMTPCSQRSSSGEESLYRQSPVRRGLTGNSTNSSSSTQSSPVSHPHQHSLSRDLSFDSLGMFWRPQRENSLDSMCSDLSMDLPSFTEQSPESATVARLDKLQEEIDQLKNNCHMMDEEFETVKCNRNLPGLSDLMEVAEHHDGELTVEDIVRQQSAKACFKGLYSLTTINRSISIDLSVDEDSPQTSLTNQTGLDQLPEEDHYPSLEWDEEYSPEEEKLGTENFTNENTTALSNHSPGSPQPLSTLETSGYSSKMDLSSSLTGSQISSIEPPSPLEVRKSQLFRSLSCESQTELWSPTDSFISDMDSPSVDNANTQAFKHANISPRFDVLTYAHQEWTGNTPKAKTILRGYKDIVDCLQYRYLRRVRGDNYCALRSAIFQTLAQGLTVPSGAQALARLSQTHNIGSHWQQKWRFNGLPYSGNNVLKGMEICLQSLDNISALLQSRQSNVEEREETLYNLLNTDPSLDLHIMEAVKLHMMATALDLHEANSKGLDVPLFSILMFARDTSELPLDFMNNHLVKVGDTGGLEHVEMFLLGYTLRVTLKVVRPSAHGTQQFVCFYPDDNVGTWPQVTLLAEDDRHYNILCS